MDEGTVSVRITVQCALIALWLMDHGDERYCSNEQSAFIHVPTSCHTYRWPIQYPIHVNHWDICLYAMFTIRLYRGSIYAYISPSYVVYQLIHTYIHVWYHSCCSPSLVDGCMIRNAFTDRDTRIIPVPVFQLFSIRGLVGTSYSHAGTVSACLLCIRVHHYTSIDWMNKAYIIVN